MKLKILMGIAVVDFFLNGVIMSELDRNKE